MPHAKLTERHIWSLFLLLLSVLPTQLTAQKKIATIPVNRLSAPSLSHVFRNYSLFDINTLEIAQQARSNKNATTHLDLAFAGYPAMKVSLRENNILSDDYKLVVAGPQGKQVFGKPASSTYAGKLDNDSNSSVYLTITDQTIEGFIKGGGKQYYIEPLKHFSKKALRKTFVLYEAKDVIPKSGYTCGVTEVAERSEQTLTPNIQQLATGTCKMVRIGIASDDSMVLRYGTPAAVAERNIAILNMMVGIYQGAQIGFQYLEFRLTSQYISTTSATNPFSPNYNGFDGEILLARFKTWAERDPISGNGTVQLWTARDIAVFIPESEGGPDYFFGLEGLASISGTCTANKYQLLEDAEFSGLAKAVIAAHETGHNLGAGHDAGGAPYVMAPSLSNPPATTFSAESLADISEYLNFGNGGRCFSSCTLLSPVAQFNASPQSVCLGSSVTFTDYSVGQVTSRSWQFSGGSPASSNVSTQVVNYSTAGLKTVRLDVSNGISGSFMSKQILVSASPAAAPITPLAGTSTAVLYQFNLADVMHRKDVVNTVSGEYTDLSCTNITALSPGVTYSGKAGIGAASLFPGENRPTRLQVLVDYNNDGDFVDDNENVLFLPNCAEGVIPFTITFPETVPLSNTFLRLRVIGLPCTQEDPTNGTAIPSNAQVLDCSVYFTALTCLRTYYKDNDGDGHGNPLVSTQACSQPAGYVLTNTDCNDDVSTIRPGALEVCDGVDNDCDGLIDEGVTLTFYKDQDEDGYGDAKVSIKACSVAEGYVSNNKDCDDTHATVYQGATEICDGLDNDCNGEVDEGVKTTFYLDADVDGYGDPAVSTQACSAPQGYVLDNTDCDDTHATVYQGATEICDGLDNNCNGDVDEGVKTTFYLDADDDGYGDPAVSTQACSAPQGYVADNTDCDDTHATVYQGATEICDGLDNDCNGEVDEGVKTTFYLDADDDGYGDPAVSTQACSAPQGYVADNTDCDDTHATVYPSATEICDGLDNDCNGEIDEGVKTTFYLDADDDGYGDPAVSTQACSVPAGYVTNKTDCDDRNTNINPATTWYKDGDNDGYSNGITLVQCARPAGYKLPSELTATGGDCNDNNYAVNAGMPDICSNKTDDNCNGRTDESCVACQTGTNLSTTNITSSSATFNWTTVVTPNAWQVRYKKTNTGVQWAVVDVPGNQNFVSISGLATKQTYNWQVRAYCGKSWTDFSSAATFTTTGTTTSSFTVTGDGENAMLDIMKIQASPNPSSSDFKVVVESNKLNERIKLIVTDVLGRVVETRMMTAGQAITFGSNYKDGTYIIVAIQGSERKHMKLLKVGY